MPTPLSDDIKEHIVKWYCEDQYTKAEIAERAECSIGLVSNVLRNHREFGQVNNPFKRYTGRPSSLTEDDLNFISAVLSANPSLYLDEIQQKLLTVQGVHVSIATLSSALVSSQLSRKVLTKAASERDEELRNVWEAAMSEFTDPDMFVALDESDVDGKTMQRTHG